MQFAGTLRAHKAGLKLNLPFSDREGALSVPRAESARRNWSSLSALEHQPDGSRDARLQVH